MIRAMPTHPGRRLRDLMGRGTVLAPGVFNALVARSAVQAGFEACYISEGTMRPLHLSLKIRKPTRTQLVLSTLTVDDPRHTRHLRSRAAIDAGGRGGEALVFSEKLSHGC